MSHEQKKKTSVSDDGNTIMTHTLSHTHTCTRGASCLPCLCALRVWDVVGWGRWNGETRARWLDGPPSQCSLQRHCDSCRFAHVWSPTITGWLHITDAAELRAGSTNICRRYEPFCGPDPAGRESHCVYWWVFLCVRGVCASVTACGLKILFSTSRKDPYCYNLRIRTGKRFEMN